MKLPRSLTSLAGPATPELQKSFLRDLKQAFRDRIDHEAAPTSTTINAHLQAVLMPNILRKDRERDPLRHVSPAEAARHYYIDGRLTHGALYDLVARTTSRSELDAVAKYSSMAGIDIINQSTDLSARYAAKLIHLGHAQEVQSMIAKHTKDFIATRSAHPVLVLYASRVHGIEQALDIFNHLVDHDSRNSTTLLVRTLLRESIRHAHLKTVLHCLGLDQAAAAGQEAGLARWLLDKEEPVEAFKVLLCAEPALAREAFTGLDIAKRLIDQNRVDLAQEVLRWVETRYSLTVQVALQKVRAALDAKLGSSEPRQTMGHSELAVEAG